MITCPITKSASRTIQRGALVLLLATSAALSLSAAQADDRGHRGRDRDDHRQLRERGEQRFYDSRFRHNHYYPIPGHRVTVLPLRHEVVVHHGTRFFFSAGVWYRSAGAHFIAVAPPIGIAVHLLPPFYSRLWIGGAPYYYANDVYYAPSPQGYVVTQPPPADVIVEEPANADVSGNADNAIEEHPADDRVAETSGNQLFIYPKQGQSAQQQEQDRRECHTWAVGQSGYDPRTASAGSELTGGKHADYRRAVSACLEGRGYTVR